MKVLVTGDREWKKPFVIRTYLAGMLAEAQERRQELIVVHGAARGVDSIAGNWAKEMKAKGLPVDEDPHPAH